MMMILKKEEKKVLLIKMNKYLRIQYKMAINKGLMIFYSKDKLLDKIRIIKYNFRVNKLKYQIIKDNSLKIIVLIPITQEMCSQELLYLNKVKVM